MTLFRSSLVTAAILAGLVGSISPGANAQTPDTADASDAAANVQPPDSSQRPTSRGYQVIHVNAGAGNDAQGDGSQMNPMRTITHALQVAPPNTVILLAAGEYSEATGEVFPLQLKPGITIQGTPGFGQSSIVIRGGGGYLSPSAGLENVAILAADYSGIGNIAVVNPHSQGYGVWVESGSPILQDNLFSGNGYAGVYIAGTGAPTIQRNYFSENRVAGLIIAGQSQARVQGNVFENTGIGIQVAPGARPSILDNRIVQNQDGLVLQANSQPILQNNLIARNRRNGVVEFGAPLPDAAQTVAQNPVPAPSQTPVPAPSQTPVPAPSQTPVPTVAQTPGQGAALPPAATAAPDQTVVAIAPPASGTVGSLPGSPLALNQEPPGSPQVLPATAIAPATGTAAIVATSAIATEPPGAPSSTAIAPPAAPTPSPAVTIAPPAAPPAEPSVVTAAAPTGVGVADEPAGAEPAGLAPDAALEPGVPAVEAVGSSAIAPEPSAVPEPAVPEPALASVATITVPPPTGAATASPTAPGSIDTEPQTTLPEAPAAAPPPTPTNPAADSLPLVDPDSAVPPTNSVTALRQRILGTPSASPSAQPDPLTSAPPTPANVITTTPEEAVELAVIPPPASEPAPSSTTTNRVDIAALRQRVLGNSGTASAPGTVPGTGADSGVPIPVTPPPVETVARPDPNAATALPVIPATQSLPIAPPANVPALPSPNRDANLTFTDNPNLAVSPNATLDPNVLMVPSPDIPVGSGGALPEILLSTGNAIGGPPAPPSRSATLGLHHKVFVVAPDEATQNQVRALVPDAFRVRVEGETMMQAGAFEDQATADAIANSLIQQGLDARVEYVP